MFSSTHTDSEIKTKKLYLLFKRILTFFNLKARLISILISFRQYVFMNGVQEPWPSRRYTTKENEKTLKENIKLSQPFEDFADNHVVLYSRPLFKYKKYYKFNLLNVNRKVREFIP